LALALGPFGALENVVLGDMLFDSGQIALLLALASWVAAGLARRDLRIPRTPFNLPWLLFVAIASLSLLDAPSIPLGLIELLKWVEIALVVWLVLDLAGNPSRPTRYPAIMRRVLLILLLAGLVQAAVGIWQFGLRGDGPEHFLVLGRFYRAYGTFEQPNPFGGYMNLVALLAAGSALGLLVSWRERRKGTASAGHLTPFAPWLIFTAVCAVAASLSVALSWSRGAWLGFMAGALALALFSTRRIKLGLIILLVAAALVGGGLLIGASAGFAPAQALLDRLVGFGGEFTLGDVRGVDINDENYAVVERLAHWQAAVGMARDDLWTGAGFGNYEVAYADYALINFTDALGHAHNYYLNLLAEVGVPGLLAYAVFWIAIVWQTIHLARRLAWPERGLAVGLLAAWVALSVHHLVDKLYVNNIYVHLGAMFGLLQLLMWPGFRDNFVGSHLDKVSEPNSF
jgi:O-antigen ligase